MKYFYLIRAQGAVGFLISKWEEGGTYPVQVYTVKFDRDDRLTCNCPSGYHRRYCKHMDMARQWVADGRPEGLPYFEAA